MSEQTGTVPLNTTSSEIPVYGMDCAECTRHVKRALEDLPGVESVEVYLALEKAVVRHQAGELSWDSLRKAVQDAGYSVPEQVGEGELDTAEISRSVFSLLGLIFGAVILVVVVGEWLGVFDRLLAAIPWPFALAAILLAGYPVFITVLRSALKGRVISHSLMTVGVLGAILAGEWATAAVVVFFMRVGDFVEGYTAGRSRQAVKDLTSMAPQSARVERDGAIVEVPVEELSTGEVVLVRPGEMIPVDGRVVEGHATVDQASITGESLPVEVAAGSRVYAATFASLGGLRIEATGTGEDTTFGRVIQLVEEAEAHRGQAQRLADRFSSTYLPVVAVVAGITYLVSGNALATVSVLVIACSCSFALATPIAVLASIGAGARRGLLFKGGRALESLAAAEVLLIDKTGTLTFGEPKITDIVLQDGIDHREMVSLAAAAEWYSEHPLGSTIRNHARAMGLSIASPESFKAIPGIGVEAVVAGERIAVGGRRMFDRLPDIAEIPGWEESGKTVIYVSREERVIGALAVADTIRPEVPQAVRQLKGMGFAEIQLLTGDRHNTAAAIAGQLQIPFQAELLPEDKIRIVREYQQAQRAVVMVGDGVNDAPALAQADVGIAMGAAGSPVAMEAAHLALMRDDWRLIPEAVRVARRTMGVVRMNFGFTVLYNGLGLSLAALGLIPPVLAAAAQSLPDLGILANSSRLLRK